MKKKKIIQTALFTLGFFLLSPEFVMASETVSEEQTKDTNEELKESAKQLGKQALDFFIKASDYADEKMEKGKEIIDETIELNIHKHEDLWLVTDIPNENPSEKRHYYFIDINPLLPQKWTTYYDKNGNKVNKNDPNIARVYEQIRYLAIGDSENRLMMRTDKNLIDGSISINYVDFNTDYTWEEEIPIEFGIFRNLDDIIPKDKQKEKYSKQDLQEVLEILNDLDYEIFPSTALTLNQTR